MIAPLRLLTPLPAGCEAVEPAVPSEPSQALDLPVLPPPSDPARVAETSRSTASARRGGDIRLPAPQESVPRRWVQPIRKPMPSAPSVSRRVRNVTAPPPAILGLAIAFGRGEGPSHSQAEALTRAEHPTLPRTVCIDEGLARGMGLANDSPDARPSVFGDSEEFARLTRHDEILLRLLNDPRPESGMTVDEATPNRAAHGGRADGRCAILVSMPGGDGVDAACR